METYAHILLFASPSFFILVLAEKLYGKFVKGDDFKSMDMISSLSSGYTNTLKDILGIGISIITYTWLVEHVALFHIPYTWLNVVIAFVVLDFAGYWGHRFNHQINFFWNQHLIHHSSEEFNLACALRQSISDLISFFTIFLLPAALLGVDPKIIAIVAPIQLFAQFWYHTTYIGKMGFLEKVIVTPSHHRVHHAINPEYIDKNHGQIFIFWDKWFGTFQEELSDVPPVYGITRPVRTWNPIKINYQHLWLMIQDAFRAKNWQDKLRIWIMPTGWRPKDVEEKYPVYKIENPYTYEKYYPQSSKPLEFWSWIQFISTFGFLMLFFEVVPDLSTAQLFTYGLFLFCSVYAYTELMDENPNAFWFEWGKNAYGFYLFTVNGALWFGVEGTQVAVPVYFILSTLMAFYFSRKAVAVPKSTAQ
ncbi:sterol desaturase family protein [Marinilongibacter aquaticus]|uniref:sterol desaturase family protein n=1 Tax=Marinilongibacter aquaticus TaxID=2975157 RepID=UPI0021BD790D|nr:sterol desaturase family protein [Marinilongibacter aquaticus]UBM60561.1 sterol desaturase family protein [Marinilongibacter aquaticus]